MKTEGKQDFKSYDLILGCALMAAIFGILTVMMARSIGDKSSDRAKYHASRLTQQILSNGMNDPNFRNPATVNSKKNIRAIDILGEEGRISKDPWGEAYYYKVFQNEDQIVAVAVWSGGPDGKADTKSDELKFQSGDRLVLGYFRGDDVGAIERLAQ